MKSDKQNIEKSSHVFCQTAVIASNGINVLIGCEESQTVCIEFRRLGFNAYSCDIQDCTGGFPQWHIKSDVLEVIKGGVFKCCAGGSVVIPKWDAAIFHPPCTYISNAGARWLHAGGSLNVERYAKGLLAKDFFMSCLNADIDFIAVENPVSSKIFEMPIHTQEIQPFQFGHPFTKKTRLWLKGFPLLEPTNVIENVEASYLPSNTGGAKRGHKFQIKEVKPENTRLAGNWFNKGGIDRQRNRSKTFEGIGKAFASQWGDFLLKNKTNY